MSSGQWIIAGVSWGEGCGYVSVLIGAERSSTCALSLVMRFVNAPSHVAAMTCEGDVTIDSDSHCGGDNEV